MIDALQNEARINTKTRSIMNRDTKNKIDHAIHTQNKACTESNAQPSCLKSIHDHRARPARLCSGGTKTSDKNVLRWGVDANEDAE
jgi:hypothetical protein